MGHSSNKLILLQSSYSWLTVLTKLWLLKEKTPPFPNSCR